MGTVIVSLCLSVHTGGLLPWPGGYLSWMGVPTFDGGVPILGSTCYVAGGMPLAFTQEDFLVLQVFILYLLML